MNFDRLIDLLDEKPTKDLLFKYSGDQDKQLLQQLSGLVSNQTTVKLTALVMTQDQEEQIQQTEHIWPGLKAFLLTLVILLSLIPNLLLCYTHAIERKNKQPPTLERLTK